MLVWNVNHSYMKGSEEERQKLVAKEHVSQR